MDVREKLSDSRLNSDRIIRLLSDVLFHDNFGREADSDVISGVNV